MVSRTAGICAMFLILSHVSSAVILRPKWYPYFPRHNQALGENRLRSDLAELTADTLGSRQARTAEGDDVPICHDNLTSEQCLNKLLRTVNRLLQLRSRRDYF